MFRVAAVYLVSPIARVILWPGRAAGNLGGRGWDPNVTLARASKVYCRRRNC